MREFEHQTFARLPLWRGLRQPYLDSMQNKLVGYFRVEQHVPAHQQENSVFVVAQKGSSSNQMLSNPIDASIK